jgi:alpha-tubulin suppressor-like RCC1 family protein
MVKLANGRVFALGNNNLGQLALGFLNTIGPTAVAQEVTALRDARDIRLGSLHGDYFSKVLAIATLHSKCTRPMTFENLSGIALLSDGSVRVWGSGNYGQTARSVWPNGAGPQTLHTPTELYPAGSADLIGVGKQMSFVLLKTGKLMAFGLNTQGKPKILKSQRPRMFTLQSRCILTLSGHAKGKNIFSFSPFSEHARKIFFPCVL